MPLYTNILGTEQYGIYSILVPISTILSTFMTLSSERAIFRLYYDYKTEIEINNFISTLFWSINIISFITLIILFIFGNRFTGYLGNIDYKTIFIPMILYTYLMSLVNFSQIIMQTEEDGLKYFKVSILYLFLFNGITLLFLYFYSKSIHSLVYATLISNILIIPYTFSSLRKRIKLIFITQCLKDILKFSLPMFFMIVMSWIINTSDRYLVANYISLSDAGVYSLSLKFASIITLFSGAIFQSYSPYFFRIVNTIEESLAKEKIAKVNEIITFIICLMSLLLATVSRPIIVVFFDSAYEKSFIYLCIVIIGYMISQLTGFLNPMIYQNKKMLGLSICAITALFVNLFLNNLFLPIWGTITSAYVNVITNILLVVLTYFLAKRNYYISFKNVFKLLITAIITLIIINLNSVCFKNLWSILLYNSLCIFVWLLCTIKFNLIDVSLIKQVIYLKKQSI